MFTQVDELDVMAGVAQQLLRRERDDDLIAVRNAHQPGRAVHGSAVVVAAALFGRARVDAHSDTQRTSVQPRSGAERTLRTSRCLHRVHRVCERGMDAIPSRLHDVTTVRLDRCAQDLVVTRQRRLHRLGMLLPQTRRTFKIGEQEGDRPRRQLRHPDPLPDSARASK
jgi:hypothetical protein